jgi:alkylated DNA repair dioxygenase AlkB
VAWFGDAAYRYTYSGVTRTALAWTADLLALKTLVEERTRARFNSCLLNRYASGREGMAWHSDDEGSLGRDPVIASLSFGAQRRFAFRHKRDGHGVELILEHGSLLVMAGATQHHWQHALPKSAKIDGERINLTFRRMVTP